LEVFDQKKKKNPHGSMRWKSFVRIQEEKIRKKKKGIHNNKWETQNKKWIYSQVPPIILTIGSPHHPRA
jgi:hypothetical protein